MKNIIASLIFGLIVGAAIVMLDMDQSNLSRFKTQDPQVAAGEWTIAVQLPPCDKGFVSFHLPERDGDVAIVYCKQFAVKEK